MVFRICNMCEKRQKLVTYYCICIFSVSASGNLSTIDIFYKILVKTAKKKGRVFIEIKQFCKKKLRNFI